MVHLGTYAPSASGSWRKVFSDELYSARTWEDDPEYAYPKQPTPVYLSNEENYLVVMTGDNKYGIVRRIAPEMMGQTMTLTLRETVAGKAKLLAHGTRKPLVENDVTVAARIMHAEYNGSFTQQLVYVGSASHFHTNREGDVAFLAPVFEGECENVFLSFREGKGGGNGMSGSTHRSGGWFPRGLLEKFRNFKPEPDGKPLDLGEFELER